MRNDFNLLSTEGSNAHIVRHSRRVRSLTTGILASIGAFTVFAVALTTFDIMGGAGASLAQTDPTEVKKVKKPKPALEAAAPSKKSSEAVAAKPAATPALSAAIPAEGGKVAEFQVDQQLQAAGVKTCLQTAGGLGRFQMAGVTEYAATSTWNKAAPDARMVSSVIGQRYGANTVSPVGLSGVISAPSADGKCDGFGIQVIPTASACAAVEEEILTKGQMLASLAGVPMLRNAQNQRVMLLPSAGNGCMIVGMNNYYAE